MGNLGASQIGTLTLKYRGHGSGKPPTIVWCHLSSGWAGDVDGGGGGGRRRHAQHVTSHVAHRRAPGAGRRRSSASGENHTLYTIHRLCTMYAERYMYESTKPPRTFILTAHRSPALERRAQALHVRHVELSLPCPDRSSRSSRTLRAKVARLERGARLKAAKTDPASVAASGRLQQGFLEERRPRLRLQTLEERLGRRRAQRGAHLGLGSGGDAAAHVCGGELAQEEGGRAGGAEGGRGVQQGAGLVRRAEESQRGARRQGTEGCSDGAGGLRVVDERTHVVQNQHAALGRLANVFQPGECAVAAEGGGRPLDQRGQRPAIRPQQRMQQPGHAGAVCADGAADGHPARPTEQAGGRRSLVRSMADVLGVHLKAGGQAEQHLAARCQLIG
eukprot:scaffold23281_cov120-Isochrysis_galbana.AAC.2